MSSRKSPQQSATLYKIGTKKTGNDGNIWIITENKNGVKKWSLYKKKSVVVVKDEKKIMKSPDEYYKQFSSYKKPAYDISFFYNELESLKKDFKKIGILLFFLKWGKTSLYAGHSDYIKNLISDYLKKNSDKYPNGCIFTSDALLYGYSIKKGDNSDGKIYLMHSIDKHIVDKFNSILISHFPNRTIGFQNDSDAIIINIKEQQRILKTKNHTNWALDFYYYDKKLKISSEDEIAISKYIISKIGNNIIFDIVDGYSRNGNLWLSYDIYDDKIEEFAKKIKTLHIPLLPKIKAITIQEGNQKKINKTWTFEY